MLIDVLNGPNLDRLGTRQPEIYGTATLAEIERSCRDAAGTADLRFRQSNAEHQLIEWIHDSIDAPADGILINPAALSFTSVGIVDALKMFGGPIVEIHISNLARREPHYRRSLVSPVATAVVVGLGAEGYPLAVSSLLSVLASRSVERSSLD